MVNPDGVRHRVHGSVVQSTNRVLKESAAFGRHDVTNPERGGYLILGFPRLLETNVLLLNRPEQPPMSAGESALAPSVAIITNAIFDTIGTRLQ